MSGETIITVVGNLTSDPDLRYTQTGLAVANFTIASTPKQFDRQSNEWKDGEALFLRASAWREFAEHVAGSLTKGARVVATGILKQRNYQDRDGQNRVSIELDVQEIGPSLRYATAQVTRAARNQAGTNQQGQQAWTGDQGVTPQGAQQEWAATALGAADPWPTPGGYSDDTPF
ncbi:single-stranded DNA-binding protein [Gryllotalpicola koreensis]|uniref:Single-stranded DNA-binding protein n=1 Tax=Gryllotalpicola koreensis TaxID=993086 RepID=A0ABP8A2R6_9MICO